MNDQYYLNLTFQLAQQNEGNTAPNPSVGAVIVKDGRLVSWAYHERAGGPHAEILSLQRAGDSASGATLYCSLEPCAHRGKTGPCVDEIRKGGIARVVFSATDQNPLVNGKGKQSLEQSGIKVSQIRWEPIEEFYAPFFQTFRWSRPYIIAKAATTANGMIAPADRNSRWITGQTSLQWVHHLRGRCDAILVGAGTVMHDQPRLTVRGAGVERSPLRVVLDSKFGLSPDDCSLLEQNTPLLICGEQDASAEREKLWNHRGIQTLRFADPSSLLSSLLTEHGVRNLLIEGGQKAFTLFHEAKFIDEYVLMFGPRLLAGKNSLNLLAGTDQTLAECERYETDPPLELDGDVVVRLRKALNV
jgi:diaminohydroxyphosphoribosylaminopyrimidine deaminase/5-amino-6-(5-phosphoribosylamino)uracil reductase